MLFRNKTNTPKKRSVSFDAYGNAVPDVSSLKIKHSSVAATIVETREVAVQSSKKPRGKKKLANKNKIAVSWFPWNSKQETKQLPATLPAKRSKAIVKAEYIPKKEIDVAPNNHKLSEFLQLSFEKVHDQFDTREQQMEKRLQAIETHHKYQTSRKTRLLIPLAVAGAIAMGYVLYVLTSMQNSMTIMSASIPVMNQHMGSMATDTQNMSGNMQAMNQSIGTLNHNVANMNSSVYQMNQQMGTVSRAMEPMGKAASTAQPFLGMMRSFMPF